MADPQLEIRVHIKNEKKLAPHEQFQNMYEGLGLIQANPNLSQFHSQASIIESELQAQQTFFHANTPPDIGTMAKYAALIQQVQPILATQPQLPGKPQKPAIQLNLSGQKQPSAATLQQRLQNANISPPAFQNFHMPIGGGAPLPPGGAGPGRGSSIPQDIQQFAQQYQAELAQIGQEVFARLEQQTLSDQMREQAIHRLREIRDSASRQALRFPMVSPPRQAIRDIERGASEMHRRLSGQASALGFSGAERSPYDQDIHQRAQAVIGQFVGGARPGQDDVEDLRRDIAIRRGEIRSNPSLDPSTMRRRTEPLAQQDRQLSELARLFPETIQRGTPGRDLASVSPGAVAGFGSLQAIRQQLVDVRQGRMGEITSTQQRELMGELNVQQQILRVEQERLRSEGLMTRERQHRFNVLQNEFRLTERDVQGAPVRMMPADIARQAGMIGPQAMIGQALQRMAFERGDERQTSGLASFGQAVERGGIRGGLMYGVMSAGSRAATSLLPTSMASGGFGQLIGGLGAAAPVVGLGMVTGAAALMLSQMNAVAGQGMQATNLWRRGASGPNQRLGNNFLDTNDQQGPSFLNDLMHQGEGLAFNRDQTLAVANTLAERGGLGESGAGPLAARVGGVLKMSRFLGLNEGAAAQGVGTMEQMNLVGTGPNRMNMETFTNSLAQAIERGNMRGRENELLGAITNLTQEFAVRGVTTPQMTSATMGLLTQMNRTGSPGLRGQFGAQVIGQMDQSIVGARGVQQALLYQSYNASTPGGMNYLQYLEAQGQGMGNPLGLQAFNRIAQLGGEGDENATRRAYILTNQFFGGNLAMMGRAKQLDELRTQGRLTPEALQAGIAGTMEEAARPGAEPSRGLQGLEGLQDNLNTLTNSVQDASSAFAPLLTDLTKVMGDLLQGVNNLVGAMTTSVDPDKAGPITPRIPTPGGGYIELPPINPGIKTPIPGVEVPNPLHPNAPGPIRIQPRTGHVELPGGIGGFDYPDISIGAGDGGTPPAGTGPSIGGIPIPLPSFAPPVAHAGELEQPEGGALPAVIPPTLPGSGPRPFLMLDQNDYLTRNINGTAVTKGAICGPTTLAMLLSNELGYEVNAMDIIPDILKHTGGSAATFGPDGPGLPWDGVDAFITDYARSHGSNMTASRVRGGHDEMLENLRQGQPVAFSVNPGVTQAALGIYPQHIMAATSADEGMVNLVDPNGGVFRRVTEQQFRAVSRPNAAWALHGYRGATPQNRDDTTRAFTQSAGVPNPGPQGIASAPSNDSDTNKATIIDEARRLGMTEGQIRVMMAIQDVESPDASDPMRFQGNDPFGRELLAGRRRYGGRGLFQFDYGGQLPHYRDYLVRQGVVPEGTDTEALEGMPQAWDPRLQTRFFQQYATNVDAFRRLGDDVSPEQVGVIGHAIQGNATGTAPYTEKARMRRGQPLPSLPEPPPEGSSGNWYTAMDQGALASSGTINVSLQPTTITLMWPDGSMAGSAQINADVDQVGHTDVNAYRTMGYYGNA